MVTAALERDSTARVVAETLEVACRDYFEFWSQLDIRPRDAEEDRRGCEVIRGGGQMVATLLAAANRFVSNKSVEHEGQPLPPPEPLVKALRDLTDSYVLLTGVQNYEHLMDLPLVPADEIRTALSDPAVHAWFDELRD